MSDEFPIRKLIVTGQRDIATLRNGSILYEVFVTDEHGQAIDQPFRAFMELPRGEVQEYEVRPHDSQEWGRTFTLLPKERESRTKQLTRQVAALERQMNDLENSLDSRVRRIIGEELERDEKYGQHAPF
jgi:hypothetical protein